MRSDRRFPRSWTTRSGQARQRRRLHESSPARGKVTVWERGRAGPGISRPRQACGLYARRVSGARGQAWYPIGKVGWLTRHIGEGTGVAVGQLGLLQLALAQPGWLDDASVAGIIGLRQGQAGDLVPFRDQAGRWHAAPGLSPLRRAAVWEYEPATGELGQLKAGLLAAGQLTPVTMEALLAEAGLRLRGAA